MIGPNETPFAEAIHSWLKDMSCRGRLLSRRGTSAGGAGTWFFLDRQPPVPCAGGVTPRSVMICDVDASIRGVGSQVSLSHVTMSRASAHDRV